MKERFKKEYEFGKTPLGRDEIIFRIVLVVGALVGLAGTIFFIVM